MDVIPAVFKREPRKVLAPPRIKYGAGLTPLKTFSLQPSAHYVPSAKLVMIYVPLLGSRLSSMILCLTASSNSLEKVLYP